MGDFWFYKDQNCGWCCSRGNYRRLSHQSRRQSRSLRLEDHYSRQ